MSSRLSSASKNIENEEVYSFKKRKNAKQEESQFEESFRNDSFEEYENERQKYQIPSPYNRVM